MATATLTTDIVKVALGRALDAGAWAGGKNTVVYNTEFFAEGAESTEFTVNAANTRYPITFTPTSGPTIGLSSVLRIWFINTDFFRQKTKALGGLTVDVTSAGGTANYYYHGNDTFKGAWEQFVIDTGLTPTVGSNQFASQTTVFTVAMDMLALGKNVATVWFDAISYGNIIRISGGTSGDEIGMVEVANADKDYLSANTAYGICIYDTDIDVYKIRGQVDIGDDSNTSTTWFIIDSLVIVGEALEWIDTDILQFNVKGNATGTCQGIIKGNFISAADKRMTMDTSDTNIDNLTVSGNTFKNITGISYQTGFIITNNVYNNCFRVDPKGSTFNNCTFANCVDATGALYWDTTCVNMDTCSFNDNTRAITIPAAETGPIDMSGLIFSGNTLDVYWEGTAGTLVINASNGTNIVTTGSAGGTISVLDSNSITITVRDASTKALLADARVHIVADAGGPLTEGTVIIDSELTGADGIVTGSINGSGQPYIGLVTEALSPLLYIPFPISGTIPSGGTSVNVNMSYDE